MDITEIIEKIVPQNGELMYIYSDGSVSSKLLDDKKNIGLMWGTLEHQLEPFSKAEKVALDDCLHSEDDVLDEKVCCVEDAEVGMYALADGRFVTNPKKEDDIKGVVAWRNPDETAKQGHRGLILTLEEVQYMWANYETETGVVDVNDGQANTKKLMSLTQHSLGFPAAEYCATYCLHGVKKGEGFLPALHQWEQMLENVVKINRALDRVSMPLFGTYLSSSEKSIGSVYVILAPGGKTGYSGKIYGSWSIRCVLAF